MPLSAVDVISPAFERMKRQLFRPFRWGQWLRFALVGFLSGEMGQNAGSGVRLPLNFVSSFPKSNEFQVLWPGRGPLFLFGVLLALLLSAVLVVVLIYIGSRMRFVLFDSIVNGECRIRESWGRYGGPAFRLFVFQILFSLMAIVSMAALIGIPLLAAVALGVFENPSRHILALVVGGIVLLFLFLLLLITLLLVHVLTKDFVVPQMALEDVSISVGWSRLWTFLKAEKGGYAGYLGMKILLDIAASIVLGIVGFILLLILLIPFGGIGLFGVLAGRAAGLDWNPVTISIAIVFGIIAVLALFFLASLVSVPMIVFFPAYSVYFFAERYRPLHERLYPPPAEPDLSTLSPQP